MVFAQRAELFYQLWLFQQSVQICPHPFFGVLTLESTLVFNGDLRFLWFLKKEVVNWDAADFLCFQLPTHGEVLVDIDIITRFFFCQNLVFWIVMRNFGVVWFNAFVIVHLWFEEVH